MTSIPRMSLRRQLVLGVSVLVAVAFLITGTVTVVALRVSALQQLDQEVLVGLDLAVGPGGPADEGKVPPSDGAAAEPAPRIGTLTVVIDADGTIQQADVIADNGTRSTLTSAQLATLNDTDARPRTPVTVDLGGELGRYRIAVDPGGGPGDAGRTVVSGSSMHRVAGVTSTFTVILVSVLGAVLLVVIAGVTVLVTRSLRPLRRVAGVARSVSQQSLASGKVALPDRVDPADAGSGTEVGQVGSALNSLLESIEQALNQRQASEDRLRQFVADASHELRTPLASILGYAELSRAENAPMSATQERSLERITGESIRLSALVNDLLLLARLDAGQTLRSEPVDLAPLLIDAVEDAHVTAPDHHWLLEVGEPVEVSGDEDSLRQVLTNILGNAAAHTPPGTTIEASLQRQGREALLSVVDDGPGIPADLQERLFDRFARDDSSRSRRAAGQEARGSGREGAGLGLAIAHSIVTAHNGRLDVASAPGRTAFTIRLPLLERA